MATYLYSQQGEKGIKKRKKYKEEKKVLKKGIKRKRKYKEEEKV
jgi:hypothetical protein